MEFLYRPGGRTAGMLFLDKKGDVSLEDSYALANLAIGMYENGRVRAKVKGDNYEGRLFTRNAWRIIGGIGGLEFTADLETKRGKAMVKFLLCEFAAKGSSGRISRN